MGHRQKAINASVKALVRDGKIRALQNDVGGFEYYTTPKGAEALARIGVATKPACATADADGNDYGRHVHQIAIEGKGGLIAQLGSVDAVVTAMNGVHLIPLTDTAVDETMRGFEARHAAAKTTSVVAR